jgi:hypothetical protein
MDKHVDLLGLLYLVWGALGLLLGVAVLLLAAGAAALAGAGAASEVAAAFTAVTLLVVGLTLVAAGAVSVWAGARLRRLHPSARLVALVLAALNLFVLPFGTALGIYTLWVLLNDGVRARFEAGA